MKSTENQRLPPSAFILALFICLFSSLAIAVVLLVIGASTLGAYAFASLGGVTTACFVWIERSLLFQIKEKELLLGLEHARRQKFQDRLYSHSMACLVRFDAGTLIVDQASPGFIKMGDSSVKEAKLEIMSADGFSTHALISGHTVSKEHIVEAAFFVSPVNNDDRIADLVAAQKDLDRFRKGMFRRETRILELKKEVNAIRREAGLPVRYHKV
jgi:hypothetical protein